MPNADTRILFILTSHGLLGSTGKGTGFHYEEVTAPYWVFSDAGCEVTVASIEGGLPPHDPGSLPEDESKRPESVRRFMNEPDASAKLLQSLSIDSLDPSRFDAVFLPGGHGTMWDLPEDPVLGRLLSQVHRDGKVIGAVCHGPAGLIGARDQDGTPIVEGRRINAFTDEEERSVELDTVVPFLLETRLRELGALFEKSPPFDPCVVADGNLVTGQNPRSAQGVAEKMLHLLREQRQDGSA